MDFPAFTRGDGAPKYKDYRDFIVRYERAPGIGFLAGWRGADGSKSLVGEPNPRQWEAYIDHQAFRGEAGAVTATTGATTTTQPHAAVAQRRAPWLGRRDGSGSP